MNEQKNNAEGTTMIPAQTDDLMVPPSPVKDAQLNVAGGKHEMPKPPEMEVVELSDGRFARIPKSAICETEKEAKKSMMPPPPFAHHGSHHKPHHKCRPGRCDGKPDESAP